MSDKLENRVRRSTRLLEKNFVNPRVQYDEDDDYKDPFGIPEEETDSETEESDHYTDSEEEASESEDKFYVGNDGTLWETTPVASNIKTHPCNVLKLGRDKKPTNLETELENFFLFLDSFVIQRMVQYTNSFMKLFTTEETRIGNMRLKDDVEIKGLIGLLILIGTFKSGTIEQLWQTDMGIGCDLCICIMSKRRFEFLLGVLHFDDYQTRMARKELDKFCHIRETFEHIVNNFQKHYTPAFMTLDEQLVAFRGRCPFKQYIPSKRAKYGIKIWALVDCSTFYTYWCRLR